MTPPSQLYWDDDAAFAIGARHAFRIAEAKLRQAQPVVGVIPVVFQQLFDVENPLVVKTDVARVADTYYATEVDAAVGPKVRCNVLLDRLSAVAHQNDIRPAQGTRVRLRIAEQTVITEIADYIDSGVCRPSEGGREHLEAHSGVEILCSQGITRHKKRRYPAPPVALASST